MDDNSEANKQEKKPTPKEKIQNLHNTLMLILKELRELHDSKESINWELEYGGRVHKVKVRPAIAYIISDSEMHHKHGDISGTSQRVGRREWATEAKDYRAGTTRACFKQTASSGDPKVEEGLGCHHRLPSKGIRNGT